MDELNADQRFLKALRIAPDAVAPEATPEPAAPYVPRLEDLQPVTIAVRITEDGVLIAPEDFEQIALANAQLTDFAVICAGRINRLRWGVGMLVVAVMGLVGWIWRH